MAFVRRHRGILPLALLLPGLAWLIIFFALPLYYQGKISLETGSIFNGFQFNWHFRTYTDAWSAYHTQFLPNVQKNLIPALQHIDFDPNRDYSVPWQSGQTGLIVRTD